MPWGRPTIDPLTGLYALSTGYVRNPFGSGTGAGLCPTTTVNYTLANCSGLNVIPFNRVDPNAIKLLNLYPLPTTGGLLSNYASSPKGFEHANSFDTRLDINFSDKNQLFFRFSLKDDPQFIPGVFGGIADGGAFQQGNQTSRAYWATRTHFHRRSSMSCAPVSTTSKPPVQLPRRAPWVFRHNLAFRTSLR